MILTLVTYKVVSAVFFHCKSIISSFAVHKCIEDDTLILWKSYETKYKDIEGGGINWEIRIK